MEKNLPEKLTATPPANGFLVFYGTRRLITVFRSDLPILNYRNPVNTFVSYFFKVKKGEYVPLLN
jgi:hypothetical protein